MGLELSLEDVTGHKHPVHVSTASAGGRLSCLTNPESAADWIEVVLTEMKAVFSIVTRGTMSMSCSEAISSSSGGVTDVLSDCGKAIVRGRRPPPIDGRWKGDLGRRYR
jgi:hypothetical protein